MNKLHTEAIRLDEVAHDTEVSSLGRGVEIVDVAGIDTRIFTLPREVSIVSCNGEVSTCPTSHSGGEAIVATGNEPMKNRRSHKVVKG